MRLAAFSFAALAFAASASLAQGVPALWQAPIGHRQATPSAPSPDVRRDKQPPSATSRPAGRAGGGSPPTLQVGPSCEAAGRGAVVLGRNKEACLGDETTAQDTLKQNWSKYSGTDKTTCIGMASTGGSASYVELLSCLEILRDAKSIEAADPLAGEMETGTSRASVAHTSRVRYPRGDRGHRRAL